MNRPKNESLNFILIRFLKSLTRQHEKPLQPSGNAKVNLLDSLNDPFPDVSRDVFELDDSELLIIRIEGQQRDRIPDRMRDSVNGIEKPCERLFDQRFRPLFYPDPKFVLFLVFHRQIDEILDPGAKIGNQPDRISEIVKRADQSQNPEK